MCCFKKYIWEVVTEDLPKVERHCSKCNTITNYINTKKFRVNANKNLVDVWLIYQCKRCKSTWNMAIYERISPSDIGQDEYRSFLSNDENLVNDYGFNIDLQNKNRAKFILDKVSYKIVKEDNIESKEIQIEIHCKYPLDIRLDKFLSEGFNVSRNKIKDMIKAGEIYSIEDKKLEKVKIRDGMNIYVSFE